PRRPALFRGPLRRPGQGARLPHRAGGRRVAPARAARGVRRGRGADGAAGHRRLAGRLRHPAAARRALRRPLAAAGPAGPAAAGVQGPGGAADRGGFPPPRQWQGGPLAVDGALGVIPFGDFTYFGLLLYVVLPAVAFGLAARGQRAWILAATL